MTQERLKLRSIVEAGIFIAIAFVLGRLELRIMPQGGSINIVAVPLVIYAVRNGFGRGVLAGAVCGVLVLTWTGVVYHPLSGLLDYVLPPAAMGLAGLFRGKWGAYKGILLGCGVGLAAHVLSGVLIFGHFMPDNFMGIPMENVFFYAFLYNAAHIVPSLVVSLLILALLSKPLKRFILRQDGR